ncbi:hypothetical protein [Polymorphobacter fuscus]|uniref:Uncharacterized protein n=1 Tax=Sandarakinorhabdus fusca TaxID=1439888 RepID=A0A7C9GQ45_9SPHN|nr:hypothetical protein [Polymorphobacter fuscus]KAB7645551.1 hypothetical protein F9290_12080 [Polymorphobacter fuscus]MQT17995.1 hypothetical protein [Polymorphobacter fuscus]NJC08623.1 hypothetical protein [Polymorphobacter fuscus]
MNKGPSDYFAADTPDDWSAGVVVRLPRQVRRGIVIEAREGVFANGSPYAFVWYEFQLGRGTIGKVSGYICPVKSMSEAKRLAKERGLPFIDRTRVTSSAPAPLPGAA